MKRLNKAISIYLINLIWALNDEKNEEQMTWSNNKCSSSELIVSIELDAKRLESREYFNLIKLLAYLYFSQANHIKIIFN